MKIIRIFPKEESELIPGSSHFSKKLNFMILKDLMEEKQLNLHQPLLSVRRFSSTVTSETDYKRKIDNSLTRLPLSPAYKSELKSGPSRNAGNVPFVWEKAPGRPKDESKPKTSKTVEEPPITPNFPPGRVSKIKQQVTDMRIGSTVSNSQNVAYLDRKVTKCESSKEETKEKESYDSDDGGDAYLDAFDTLSRTESFFLSSSVSGLSGWDGQEGPPSRSFSRDQKACDFMIDRFLPAAKAMISQTPHYASKKVHVGQEQQKQKKKEVNKVNSRSLNQHRPKYLPLYTKVVDTEESDDCNVESENYSTTACGLFPRFCLLNPIPGLRMVDKVQRNVVHGMQAKSAASNIESTKEQTRTPCGKKSVESKSCFTEEKEILCLLVKSKHGIDPHHRGCSKLVSCESTQGDSSYESSMVEKTLYVDSAHKVKSQTNNIRGDSETLRKDNSIYKNRLVGSSLENSKGLDALDVKAASQPKSSESLDSPFLVCYENSNNDRQMEMTYHSKTIESKKQGLAKLGNQGSDLHKDFVVISSPKVVECKKIINSGSEEYRRVRISDILTQDTEVDLKNQPAAKSNDGKIDLERQCTMKLDLEEISDASYFGLPLVLPSLKAPSESWLKRTLPTISKKNIDTHSNLVANAPSRIFNTTSLCPKWETIVKSSKF
ncbi:hypothetical protein RJT34_29010 [Clitoria ternatea]|uniref:Uncharacterized protein n=1 Tax=Clitoria ternatea TaxID=43366 RepID=A0AAN9IBW0_CLITE